MGYFEDSFLIESAQRYDIKGKAYIETPKKYYFSDLGLRNARINFRQFEQTHSMENVIYNELRMRGYSVDVGVVPIAEKDAEGKVIPCAIIFNLPFRYRMKQSGHRRSDRFGKLMTLSKKSSSPKILFLPTMMNTAF